MKKLLSAVLCSLLIGVPLTLATAATPVATNYTVTDILPSDVSGGAAYGISNAGHVVGSYNSVVGASAQAFIWDRNNGFRTLDAPGKQFVVAFAVNDKGVAVGQYHDQLGYAYACFWDADGGFHDLGRGTFLSINNNGLAVGEGKIWDLNGTPNLVASFPADSWAINDLGQVAGGVYQGGSDKAFVRDPDGTMRTLWDSTMSNSRACAINNLSQAVGFYKPASGGYDIPCLWDSNGNRQEIGVLDGHDGGWARAINDAGTVVGYSLTHLNASDAFVWTQGEGLRSLPSLGIIKSSAYGINSSGMIAGSSYNASVSGRAVIWTPVPEPSSAFALLMGIGGIAGVVRRMHPRL